VIPNPLVSIYTLGTVHKHFTRILGSSQVPTGLFFAAFCEAKLLIPFVFGVRHFDRNIRNAGPTPASLTLLFLM
jgi:hypothetical protein